MKTKLALKRENRNLKIKESYIKAMSVEGSMKTAVIESIANDLNTSFSTVNRVVKSIVLSTLLLCSISVKAQPLTHNERNTWNAFVDYVASKGYTGSPKLNKGNDLSVVLFNQYCKKSALHLDYTEFVTRVQMSIAAYRNKAIAQIKSGEVKFDGKIEDFMPGLSVVDGWAGSKTTAWKFPSDTVKVYNQKGLSHTKSNNTY